MNAVLSGHAEEDDSGGHMLLTDAAARPAEDRLIAIAHNDLRLLRKVLRDSADSTHRALAAQLLGYAKDLQSVVPDLVYAMSDSSDGVRNNAMRALLVFTRATKVKPPRVPHEPFIALLNSPVWTDRNKSSFALMQMASTRDPALLGMLREQALPSLVEMARWSDRGHAAAAFWILGNVAGLDDKDIAEDWDRNDRERVIEGALGH
jgi:HEAT repeat protein